MEPSARDVSQPTALLAVTLQVVSPSELLSAVDLFSELAPEEMDRLVKVSKHEDLRRGDVLFHEGDAADRLYVVTRGRIAISRRSAEGRESVMALMEPGDLFGEMGLFQDTGRSAEARALERSGVLAVGFGPIRQIYEERPELLWNVVTLLADRLRTMDEVLADSMFLDVTGRTAKRLLEIAGDEDEFVLPVTQEELAAIVGASRERVNKAIASFVKLGWVEQNDRRYKISDRTQLTIRSR